MNIFKISLIISLLGILLLLIYSENITLPTKNIQNITNKDVDKQIKIVGQVIRLTDLPGLMILDIKDNTEQITVVIFKEETLNINKNDFLEIQGKVAEYRGELEIIAEKIIKR
jgi:DNA/RNA endonuclease YhcR with UshA esterase domain